MRRPRAIGTAALSAAAIGAAAVAAADPSAREISALKVPDGLSISEFKGYEDWGAVAVSQTEGAVKLISANPAMIAAYKAGAPGGGKRFPEGSRIVKIEWARQPNPASPYPVQVP